MCRREGKSYGNEGTVAKSWPAAELTLDCPGSSFVSSPVVVDRVSRAALRSGWFAEVTAESHRRVPFCTREVQG